MQVEISTGSDPSKMDAEQERNVVNRSQYSQKFESYEATTVGHSSLVVINPAKPTGAPNTATHLTVPPMAASGSFEKGDLAYIGLAEAWFGNVNLPARKAA